MRPNSVQSHHNQAVGTADQKPVVPETATVSVGGNSDQHRNKPPIRESFREFSVELRLSFLL